MKRKNILQILLICVFPLVFNVVFFITAGSSQPVSVWVSYGCIHFAYLMTVLTPVLNSRNSSAKAVFGFSLYSASSIYFFVELAVGIVFIVLKQPSPKLALIIQLVLAGAYIVILLTLLLSNENTAESLERHEAETAYIKELALRVSMLQDRVQDKSLNHELERLYDTVHASPAKSNERVRSLEREALNIVDLLADAVEDQDADTIKKITAKIQSLMEERNKILNAQ